MKAILSYSPDHRLQTLRKAFGIEDYKIAGENGKGLSNEIRTRSKEFAAMALEVQGLKGKLELLKSSISQKKVELEQLAANRKKFGVLIQTQKVKREELRSKQLALKEETGKGDALLALIAEKEKEIRESTKQITLNKSKIENVQPKIVEVSGLGNPGTQSPNELKLEIQRLEEELKFLRNTETQIRSKFSDYKMILDKGVCPTCDRKIDPDGFSDLVEHKEAELKIAQEKVGGTSTNLQQAKKVLELKIQFDQAQTRLEDFRKSLSE